MRNLVLDLQLISGARKGWFNFEEVGRGVELFSGMRFTADREPVLCPGPTAEIRKIEYGNLLGARSSAGSRRLHREASAPGRTLDDQSERKANRARL